ASPQPQTEVAEEIPARADEEVQESKPHFAIDGDGVKTFAPSSGSSRGGLPVPATLKGASFVSPRIRARMAELQLTTADLAGITGTGAGNRVTIKIWRIFCTRSTTKARRKLRRFARAWPTRCGAAGRAHY